jgi:DDE superfamily endonuclease
MEDVLDVYARPFDPRRPLVGFDEGCKELRDDIRAPWPAAPGHPLRYDTEYTRHGSASFFLWCAPLLGQRGVLVSERRTRIDFAHAIRDLVELHFPEAERIVWVMDNLNTHTAASLYAAFPPAQAKRLWDTLEVHDTPKHGSWLNIAEIELSVLGRQCLDRRMPDSETLATAVAAWVERRNAERVRVNWRFTTDDARIKLKQLYPILDPVN